jgi:Methylamine utilisation protein MauE
MIDPALGSLIVIGAALLFAVASAHKLKNLALFAETFAAYRLLPQGLARRSAWLVPSAELALTAALLSSASRRWAILGSICLLAVYASALSLNLARGRRDLDCGCTAMGSRRRIAAWMVWRNVALALALGAAALPWTSRPLGAADLLTIVGGVAAGAALYAAVDRLLGAVAPRAALLTGAS